MADCEPKQTNDCTQAGSGPSCYPEPKTGSAKKEQCLKRVREQCEEAIEKCVKECNEKPIALYQKSKMERDKEEQDAQRARWEAFNNCTKGNDRYQEIAKAIETDNWVYGGTLPFKVLEARTSVDNPHLYELTGERRLANEVQKVRWLNKMPLDKLKTIVQELHHSRRNDEQEQERQCPSPKSLIRIDSCDNGRIRQLNGEISACIQGCWVKNAEYCKTVHCSCGLLKCEGPDEDLRGVGGPSNPKTSEPTETVSADFPDATSMAVTLSSYNLPIEIVYSRAFIPGNIVWIGEVTENRVTRIVQEWDANAAIPQFRAVNRFVIDNYIDFHIGVAAGEIADISRIWMDGVPIYDKSLAAQATLQNQDRLEIRILKGTDADKVQAEESVAIGFGRVPAYRNVAGIYIKNMNLTFLNQFPSFKIEVIKAVRQVPDHVESAAYSGDVFSINPRSRRLFVNEGDEIVVLDYDSLEPITSDEIVDLTDYTLISATELPNIAAVFDDTVSFSRLTDGDDFTAVPLAYPVTNITPVRFNTNDNIGHNVFLANGDDGSLTFLELDEVKLEVSTYDEILGYMIGPPGGIFTGRTPRTDISGSVQAYVESVFVTATDGTYIEITEFATNFGPTITGMFSIGDGGYTSNLEDIYDGASDIVIHGATFNTAERAVVLFYSFDGNFRVTRWRPGDGSDNGTIDWTVEIDDLPMFGQANFVREDDNINPTRFIYWLQPSGEVAKLDVSDGTITISDGIDSFTSNRQFYDSTIGAITYWTDDLTVGRLFVDRVPAELESLADVVRDIAERSGLDSSMIDVSDLTSTYVTGFRSGSDLSGAGILAQLFEVYPTVVFGAARLSFTGRGTGSTTTVDPDWLEKAFAYTLDTEKAYARSATVSYYSDNLDGEPAVQTLTLPNDVDASRESISRNYSVLETDDYMRRLAELFVFAAQENDAYASVRLPWMFLDFTPGDMIRLPGEYRCGVVEIGSDNFISITLRQDSHDKYNTFGDVPLFGQDGYGVLDGDTSYPDLPYPIGVTSRCLFPEDADMSCVYFGISDIVEEDLAKLSVINDEYTYDALAAYTPTKSIMWGTLETAPAVTYSPFTTQREGFLVVKFATTEIGERLAEIDTQFRIGEAYDTLETLYREPAVHALIVGSEVIQFFTYEIALDGQTVTFRTLMRARFCTDQYITEHEEGEVVFLYQTEALIKVKAEQITSGDLSRVKVAASGVNTFRAADYVVNESDFDALPVTNANRLDVTPLTPSVAYPANNTVVIQAQLRGATAWPFTNWDVQAGVPYTYDDAGYVYDLYLLRAAYDAGTFNSERGGVGTSYIMYRTLTPEQLVVASITNDTVLTDTLTPDIVFGVLFDTGMQDAVTWEAATEPLVCVFIVTSPLGVETRHVSTFSPGDYTKRRQRGIVDLIA